MKILTAVFLALGTGAVALSGCAPASSNGGSTTPSARRNSAAPRSFAAIPKAGMRATCTVMGHAFTIQKGTAFAVHKGRYYVFCCPGCKPKFVANPDKFINP
jgi:YHS domain-containing protein